VLVLRPFASRVAAEGREREEGWGAGDGGRGSDPPEEMEIAVQKVAPTRPELSLEIGVLWLGDGISDTQLSRASRRRSPPLCLSIGERPGQDQGAVLWWPRGPASFG
jgi:hypothetical protein